ncbi:hypothetical protein ABG768_005569 [Culter alburnus]|uniref:Uncharacterized protein n=1 Tax=Culter alburnus TaxID=194366 RepID=A0AAW1ZV97_CULAL
MGGRPQQAVFWPPPCFPGLLGLGESASSLGGWEDKTVPRCTVLGVQIAILGQSGGGLWHSNSSPAVAQRRKRLVPTSHLWEHSGRWIGWPDHQRRQSVWLRAYVARGCSHMQV